MTLSTLFRFNAVTRLHYSQLLGEELVAQVPEELLAQVPEKFQCGDPPSLLPTSLEIRRLACTSVGFNAVTRLHYSQRSNRISFVRNSTQVSMR